MKLLFDSMLSHKLVRLLAAEFPDSVHTRSLGYQSAADPVIWEYAKANHFTIVTKDSDYEDLSLRRGSPPKVVLIASGNGPSEPVRQALSNSFALVKVFIDNRERGVLFLG